MPAGQIITQPNNNPEKSQFNKKNTNLLTNKFRKKAKKLTTEQKCFIHFFNKQEICLKNLKNKKNHNTTRTHGSNSNEISIRIIFVNFKHFITVIW